MQTAVRRLSDGGLTTVERFGRQSDSRLTARDRISIAVIIYRDSLLLHYERIAGLEETAFLSSKRKKTMTVVGGDAGVDDDDNGLKLFKNDRKCSEIF